MQINQTNEVVGLKEEVATHINGLIQDLTNVRVDLENSSDEVRVKSVIELERQVKAIQEVASALTKVASEYKGTADEVKSGLLTELTDADLKSKILGQFKLTRCKSPASVDLQVNPEELPTEFQRISADKRKIASALKGGRKVEGAELQQGEHIRISLAR